MQQEVKMTKDGADRRSAERRVNDLPLPLGCNDRRVNPERRVPDIDFLGFDETINLLPVKPPATVEADISSQPYPKAESQRRRRKDIRPREIAAAALDVFVAKGYAAARIGDISSQAGVSKGTVYLYFDSKEALFKSVIEESVVPAIELGERLAVSFNGHSSDLLNRLLKNPANSMQMV